MGVNDRKSGRVYLSLILTVFRDDVPAGHIIDLSPTGIMLMTDAVYDEGVGYDLSLNLPENLKGKGRVLLPVTCRWVKPYEIDPHFFQVGLEFIDMDEDLRGIMKGLVAEFHAK